MIDIVINFINTYVVKFVVNVVLAAIILLVGFKLTKFIVARLRKHGAVLKLDSNIGTLILHSLRVVMNAFVIIIAIQILGVPSATIIAVIGSCGLAIGLALQGGLSNLAGGVMIMIFKPFHSGDYISTKEGDGYVEEIGIFYTRLTTVDNRSINIPNSVLSSTSVINLFDKDIRRVDVDVSVPYGADIEVARRALLDCAAANPLVLDDPKAKVIVSAHEDSAVKLMLQAFAKSGDYWRVRFELLESSLKAIEDAGLEIPFPQFDVHMKP